MLRATRHIASVFEQLINQLVDSETFRHRGQLFANAGQFGQRHTGISLVGPFGAQESGPISGVLILVVGQDGLDGTLSVFHELTIVFDQLVGLTLGPDALSDKERTSVVEGKTLSGRGDCGRRRLIKTTKKTKKE